MNELPIKVTDVLGTVINTEQQSPGVFYVAAYGTAKKAGGEYYLVKESTPEISKAAKAYGEPFPENPDYLLYAQQEEASGWGIIQYEVCRYRLINKLPLQEGTTLPMIAIYNAELYPEYFGEYPVPYHTPKGFTLRHKKLANGIFLLETSNCARMLTICYPIWKSELSKTAINLSVQAEQDTMFGSEYGLGYLFFDEKACCIPLWELWSAYREIENSGLVNKAALMNAILKDYPQYAKTVNRREIMTTNLSRQIVGPSIGLKADPAHTICPSGEGTAFLDF